MDCNGTQRVKDEDDTIYNPQSAGHGAFMLLSISMSGPSHALQGWLLSLAYPRGLAVEQMYEELTLCLTICTRLGSSQSFSSIAHGAGYVDTTEFLRKISTS